VTSRTGCLYAAKTPQPFTFDADGNLLSRGQQTNCVWSAENRIISLTSEYNFQTNNIQYIYDAQGRRPEKPDFKKLIKEEKEKNEKLKQSKP